MKCKALQTHMIKAIKVFVDNHTKMWYSIIKSSNNDLKRVQSLAHLTPLHSGFIEPHTAILILSRFSEKFHKKFQNLYNTVYSEVVYWTLCTYGMHFNNFKTQSWLNDWKTVFLKCPCGAVRLQFDLVVMQQRGRKRWTVTTPCLK